MEANKFQVNIFLFLILSFTKWCIQFQNHQRWYQRIWICPKIKSIYGETSRPKIKSAWSKKKNWGKKPEYKPNGIDWETVIDLSLGRQFTICRHLNNFVLTSFPPEQVIKVRKKREEKKGKRKKERGKGKRHEEK